MTHVQLFDHAITLAAAQLGAGPGAPDAKYAVRISELIKLNYQAAVLAWNEIQPDASESAPR